MIALVYLFTCTHHYVMAFNCKLHAYDAVIVDIYCIILVHIIKIINHYSIIFVNSMQFKLFCSASSLGNLTLVFMLAYLELAEVKPLVALS